MKDPSQYIYVPEKNIVLKTQPFYSMFYYTDPQLLQQNYRNNIQQNMQRFRRRTGQECPEDVDYRVIKNMPFHLFGSRNGRKNMSFLLAVFVATILVGTITFSYWHLLLGESIQDADVQRTLIHRSVFLSVLFVVLTLFLTVAFYEFFTLKRLSLSWFRKHQTQNDPSQAYTFLMNTRKFMIWGFMIVWLVVVLFLTSLLTKRPQQAKNLIVMNIIACVVLFTTQYAYYKTSIPAIKTFCIFVSVFVILLFLVILYGI